MRVGRYRTTWRFPERGRPEKLVIPEVSNEAQVVVRITLQTTASGPTRPTDELWSNWQSHLSRGRRQLVIASSISNILCSEHGAATMTPARMECSCLQIRRIASTASQSLETRVARKPWLDQDSFRAGASERSRLVEARCCTRWRAALGGSPGISFCSPLRRVLPIQGNASFRRGQAGQHRQTG